MKIFFENRTIELANSAPDQIPPATRLIEFTTEDELNQILNDFLIDQKSGNLILWSKKEEEKWKKQFFKLFKKIDAAGGIVKNEAGKILFIFRLGRWDLPKGKLKKGESPEDGAIREVREETGLQQVEILRPLPDTYHIYQLNGKTILKRTFWFEMLAEGSQHLSPQSEEDISDVAWIEIEKLSIVLENTYASLQDLLKSYLC
ncbi:MAG: NUDIX domain-containing protein [Bacteroidetes bacterium]|nr:NUDIX domain-containing protein [Bacteroidota bacterium]